MRPKSIDLRLEDGHYEWDLIIGKKQNDYQNIVTLNNCKTRKLYATFIRTKNPWIVNEAFRKMIKENNLEVKTLTLDNGTNLKELDFLQSKCISKSINVIHMHHFREDQTNT